MIDSKHRLIVAIILLVITFVAAVAGSYFSASRQLSSLEASLMQVVVLTFGLLASFIFGQLSAEKSGQELLRSHARSAFRRVLSLYRSLSRLAAIIENDKETSTAKTGNSRGTLDKVEAIVMEQITSADDAMADWKDICPQYVEEVLKMSSKNVEIKAAVIGTSSKHLELKDG